MTSSNLTNIRKHRRRHAFTQGEIAYLLGGICGTKVSRYECSIRKPQLHTALACQVILDAPVHELFPGVYENATNIIRKRARALLKELESKGCPDCKRERLIAIIENS